MSRKLEKNAPKPPSSIKGEKMGYVKNANSDGMQHHGKEAKTPKPTPRKGA